MAFEDVSGFYRVLEIAADASPDEVKRAYRQKVKETHPDSADGGGDTSAFQAIRQAYEILSDAEKRAVYDRSCTSAGEARERAQKQKEQANRQEAERDRQFARREAEQRRRADAKRRADIKRRAERSRRTQARRPAHDRPPEPEPTVEPQAGPQTGPQAEPPTPHTEPIRCERCGEISAQPRYVVFERTIGRLNKSLTESIAGIWCRSCADKIAMRASLVTWLLGWWSLPKGPAATVRTLIRNLAGGFKPAAKNAEILTRQAHAFWAMDRREVASDLAHQANQFQRTPSIDHLMVAGSGRRLRDRWALGGIAFIVQALPVGLMISWLLVKGGTMVAAVIADRTDLYEPGRPQPYETAPATDRPIDGVTDGAPPSDQGLIQTFRYILVPSTALRDGPGPQHQILMTLPQFDRINVITVSDNGWALVTTETGVTGFVDQRDLTPGRDP